ncbi:PAS domain-containing hybrid sensor histidine kinase/response regulator [Thiomicrorhabdus sp.]|uniref:PAS domain-containing hybrid sensor histidine kinase/response regulator n=1 Tax=Thiomicrorhabdus sp. TaxID=2039724 RepID=UPI002AA89D6F|nr:ATP-binding protein [Thiomicrorhabdus sp.]
MSNQNTQDNLKKRPSKTKFRLPLIFWFSMLGLAISIAVVASYILSQNELRVSQAAKISANGLASFVSDYVEKHQLIVKSIAYHHQDRIMQLSKGGGYPYDLSEIENDVRELFPPDTEFAIINQKGKIMVGSHVDRMGPKCRKLIKSSVNSISPATSRVRAHSAPNGEFHFDILFPIMVGNDWAGLWIKLSFKPLERFIKQLNIKEYQLVISEQIPPYRVLLGHPSTQDKTLSGFNITDEIESSLNLYKDNPVLAVAPIDNVAWQVRAIQRKAVFDEYVDNVLIIAFLIFLVIFTVSVIIYLFFKQLQEEREKVKQAEDHDELFNAGPTVLLEKRIDRNMSILYSSPNVQHLLGKEAKSLIDHSFLEWVYPEDVDTVRQNLLAAYVENADKVEMVYRLKVNGNGGYKWIYDLSHILYNKAGKPELLRGYITSIHAQKTAEKNATDLIQSVPESIFVIDVEGRILNTNTAAEHLLNCPKDDLKDTLFSLWLEAESFSIYEQLKQHYLDLASSKQTGLSKNEPLFLRDSKGQRISVEINFNQIELNGNTLLVQVVRDITVQQKTQQQLSLAKERAEALAKARSRFVATVSHEIRTPMNGVLGMTDLLLDTPLNSTQTQYLQAIQQSGDVLLKIINEVLDFAKLDEGQVVLNSEKVNIRHLIEEILHLLSSLAEEKGLALKYEVAADVPIELMGDSMRIRQLLMNLLGNALKFTEHGHISVNVKQVSNQKEPLATHEVNTGLNSERDKADIENKQILIEVVDTGIGIEPDNLPKLFDSFTQADSSTSRQFGGTGLGLAICRQLTELMQGQIGVESKPNQGSCFWVKLPLIEVVNSTASNLVSQDLVADLPPGNEPLSNKNVLLVEDNDINQKVIKAFLQRLGANVYVADNGLKGVELWRIAPQRYQLIIMDCQMPVMDGFDATRMIRKEEMLSSDGNHIPIIALTANVLVQDKKRCIQVGMNDFLAKPIEKESFNEMVIKWCL